MPNYLYKCTECNHEQMMTLPISSNVSARYDCTNCQKKQSLTRRIVASNIPRNTGKVWAGDWFKKTYGHDIAEGAYEKLKQKAEYEKGVAELKEHDIRFNIEEKP